MAKFNITVRAYADIELVVEAKDKIDASAEALKLAKESPLPDMNYSIQRLSVDTQPLFNVGDSVIINRYNTVGTVMKRTFDELLGEESYKVLYDGYMPAILGTFLEHQLSKDNGTVHN
jgi:hypothetical protein